MLKTTKTMTTPPATAAVTDVHHALKLESLTPAAFQPFGDVIQARQSGHHFSINSGFAERFHDLARIDVSALGGQPVISIFKAKPRQFPMQLLLLERHPLGSQAFVPMSDQPFLVVVAPAGDAPDLHQLRCFLAAPGQGVNYARGIWHHPLIALHAPGDFLVLDRASPQADANCDEYPLAGASFWIDGTQVS